MLLEDCASRGGAIKTRRNAQSLSRGRAGSWIPGAIFKKIFLQSSQTKTMVLYNPVVSSRNPKMRPCAEIGLNVASDGGVQRRSSGVRGGGGVFGGRRQGVGGGLPLQLLHPPLKLGSEDQQLLQGLVHRHLKHNHTAAASVTEAFPPHASLKNRSREV